MRCDQNRLISLSHDSDNLKRLSCSRNEISHLSVSGLGLEELRCSFNKISSLKMVSSSLRTLYCAANEMQSLSLTCPNLIDLDCSMNLLSKTELECPSMEAFGYRSTFFKGSQDLAKTKEMHKLFNDCRLGPDLAHLKMSLVLTSCRADVLSCDMAKPCQELA